MSCDARQLTVIGLLLTGVVCFAGFSWVAFEHQERYPPCCDAPGYAALGVVYQQEFGVAIEQARSSRSRTFGYPYFLSRVFHLADTFSDLAGVGTEGARVDANRRLVLAWLQGGLYLSAVSLLFLSECERNLVGN